MTRDAIIKELINRGYSVKAQNVVKNGVELEGIMIRNDSNIAPIVYTKAYIEDAEKNNLSLDEVVSEIIRTYEENKTPDIDFKKFSDKGYILNNIYIALQKVSEEDVVKKNCEFEGIECYLYVRGNLDYEGHFTAKVTRSLLNSANISEDEAWARAEVNSNAETTIDSLSDLLRENYDIDIPDDYEMQLFVLSNNIKSRGASSILNKKALSDFGNIIGAEKLVVLPSSVHEMILVPYTEEMEIDYFSEMVATVNDTEVDPIDRLTDRAYIITV